MIKSFRCKDTEKLYNKQFVKKFSGIERLAIKRLRILESANTLEALAGLPSNRLERLKGDRIGGSSRLCVIIFAYGIVKCLSGKTFSAIWRNKLSV